jgi:hypothetical protein
MGYGQNIDEERGNESQCQVMVNYKRVPGL